MKNYLSLYWMLCSFYFFSAAIGGILGPYWPLYLKSIGFDADAISKLSAITIGGSFFAPYLWAWIADHTGNSFIIIRVAATISLCFFSGVLVTQSFWWLILLLGGFYFFWNAILPQLQTNTMNYLEEKNSNYGNVRLWGSVGFIVATLIFGIMLDNTSITIVPQVAFSLLAVVVLLIFFISKTSVVQRKINQNEGSILKLLTQPMVLSFMAAAFMMFISCSPYGVFFSIYLEENSYEPGQIGLVWATGMIAQVVVFLMMSRLISAFSFKTLLMAAYIFTTVRWLLIGFYVNHLPLLLFAQILQSANIGVFHTVSIYIIHFLFKGKYQYRGQAAYITVGGIGGIIGALGSGYLWERFPPSVSFSLAALATMVAFVITWRHIGEI